jgi:hypothetical protein
MLINRHKSWARLLGALGTKNGLFKAPVEIDTAKSLLSPVFSVAKIISSRVPELLNKNHLRICIAGAEFHDTINSGNSFGLLPILLGDIDYSVDLLGDKVAKGICHNEDYTLSHSPENVSIKLFPIILGQYIRDNTPDIIIMLHPGMEEYANSWLVNDDGVKLALEKNIRIFGASFGDEAVIDKLYMNAHGYDLCDIRSNPFKRDEKINFGAGIPNNLVEWGSDTWEIIFSKAGANEFISELIPSWKEMISLRESNLLNPFEAMYTKTLSDEHGLWHNIIDQVFVSFTEGVIVDNNGEILVEEIEVDVADLSAYKEFKAVYQGLKCAVVFKEYVKDMIDDPESSNDGMHLFSGHDLDGVFGQREKRALQDNELQINKLLSQYEGASLVSKLTTEHSLSELKTFLDEKKYNLLHLACSRNDVELIKLARMLDIQPNERNNDQYSALDICVADGGIEGLNEVLKLFDDVNVDSQGNFGFAALHHCITREQPEMAKKLIAHGANSKAKNSAGMTYENSMIAGYLG